MISYLSEPQREEVSQLLDRLLEIFNKTESTVTLVTLIQGVGLMLTITERRFGLDQGSAILDFADDVIEFQNYLRRDQKAVLALDRLVERLRSQDPSFH